VKRIATPTMNPSIDLSTSVEYVIADRKLRCKSLQREPGGGGINISRVIHRLGGDLHRHVSGWRASRSDATNPPRSGGSQTSSDSHRRMDARKFHDS